jgi:2-polyprenyl-3-methyl-5-hydroxy-6-metoxy-1,4-benzoquinol methylase
MVEIDKILKLLKREYYDFGFCRFPIENTIDYEYMLGVTFNEILGEKLLGATDFVEGTYEIDNVRMKRGDVVLDCGANLGLFTVLACDRGCKVYAIEPMPKNIRTLERDMSFRCY